MRSVATSTDKVATSRHGMGILMLVAAMACFAASDALAKQLSSRLPAVELVWFRYLGLLASVCPLLIREGAALRSKRLGVQIGRSLGLVGSAGLFILALGKLPIAEATAMVFASPLFVTLLSALLLRERVDAMRWIVVTAGFLGVLIVMRPGTSAFQAAVLLPVGSSIAWAVAVICTRKASETDSVATTMVHSTLIGMALLTVLVVPTFVEPDAHDVLLLVAMVSAWCAAQWLTVGAYHRAHASTLAPFAYSQLLFANLLGIAVFGQLPDSVALIGMAVILSCGAVAAWRSVRTLGAVAAEEEALR